MKGSEAGRENSRRYFLKSMPVQIAEGFRSFAKGVLSPGEKQEAFPRIARLNVSQCLAWGGMDCQLCYLACPLRDRALVMAENRPVIIAGQCDGCAMCESACQTVNDFPAVAMVAAETPSA